MTFPSSSVARLIFFAMTAASLSVSVSCSSSSASGPDSSGTSGPPSSASSSTSDMSGSERVGSPPIDPPPCDMPGDSGSGASWNASVKVSMSLSTLLRVRRSSILCVRRSILSPSDPLKSCCNAAAPSSESGSTISASVTPSVFPSPSTSSTNGGVETGSPENTCCPFAIGLGMCDPFQMEISVLGMSAGHFRPTDIHFSTPSHAHDGPQGNGLVPRFRQRRPHIAASRALHHPVVAVPIVTGGYHRHHLRCGAAPGA